MKSILTPKSMYECDSYCINQLEIPSAILMENAAHSSANYIKELVQYGSEILIVCGSGNNGGDGFAIARHLIDFYDIHCVWIGSLEKMSDETSSNYNILDNFDICIDHIENEEDLQKIDIKYDCVIDSLIGIGGSENLRGIIVPLMIKINSISAIKIAIDSPSGLNSLNGNADINSFKADYTLTMFAEKCGQLINDGPDLTGVLKVVNLGVPKSEIAYSSQILRIEENKDLQIFFKNNKNNTSKFDFGRVVVIAGSKQYPGAGTLVANACIKTGAGLVHLISSDYNKNLLPEIIPYKLQFEDTDRPKTKLQLAKEQETEIFDLIKKADVIVFGSGIGTKEDLTDIYNFIIKQNDKIIIIDADGLKYIKSKSKLGKNIILTPHIYEYSKLINTPVPKINENRIESAIKTANNLKTNILLKGSGTILTDGELIYINSTGNSALSTAGSGDVLSGILAGILAINHNNFGINNILYKSAIATFIHGKTAEIYTNKFNPLSMTASDIIDNIKHVIPSYN